MNGTCNETKQTTNEHECVLDQRPHRTIILVSQIVVMVIQVFLCACIFVNRKKLSHKSVNIYAVNAVVVNLFNSIIQFVNSLYGYVGAPIAESVSFNQTNRSWTDSTKLQCWLFLKTLEGVLLLALPFSLAILVGAMQSNLFYIHRMVVGMSQASIDSEKDVSKSPKIIVKKLKSRLSKINKKKKAIFFIVLNWTLPTFLALMSLLKNDCLFHCSCPYHYVIKGNFDVIPCPICRDCHVLWYPGTNAAVREIVIVWAFLTTLDVVLLIYSFVKFSKVRTDHKKAAVSAFRFCKRRSLKLNLDSNEVGVGKDQTTATVQDHKCKTVSATGKSDTIKDKPSQNKETLKKAERDASIAMIKQQSGSSKGLDIVVATCSKREAEVTFALSEQEGNYEDVKLSNSFLLRRLKTKLLFLLLVVFVLILGYGAIVVYSFVLTYHPFATIHKHDEGLLILVLPAVLAGGINAIVLCNSTAALKMAVISSIRSLLHFCNFTV